jgi:hypothetical protein
VRFFFSRADIFALGQMADESQAGLLQTDQCEIDQTEISQTLWQAKTGSRTADKFSCCLFTSSVSKEFARLFDQWIE